MKKAVTGVITNGSFHRLLILEYLFRGWGPKPPIPFDGIVSVNV